MPETNTSLDPAHALAEHVVETTIEDVPEETITATRLDVLDTFGAILGGSGAPGIRELTAVTERWGGLEEARLAVIGGKMPAHHAALINSAMGHALDFDDMSYAGQVHGSVIILPAVLAAAERNGVDGQRLLEAFLGGSETAYILGSALSYSHYLKGWWATATLGGIGAALGSGMALGLNLSQLTAAISLSAIQANGMVAVLGYDAKPIIAGQAARLGVESAILASQGNTAPEMSASATCRTCNQQILKFDKMLTNQLRTNQCGNTLTLQLFAVGKINPVSLCVTRRSGNIQQPTMSRIHNFRGT